MDSGNGAPGAGSGGRLGTADVFMGTVGVFEPAMLCSGRPVADFSSDPALGTTAGEIDALVGNATLGEGR